MVGVSGIGVNFIVIGISLSIFDFSDPVALALGIFFSMTSNYLLNRIWTFQSAHDKRTEYPKYVLSNAVGIGLQYVVALLLEIQFELAGFFGIDLLLFFLPSIYLASTVGIGVGFIANFLLSKYFVFS
jgi:putative flippase GtrA